jgi:hypothetical protein
MVTIGAIYRRLRGYMVNAHVRSLVAAGGSANEKRNSFIDRTLQASQTEKFVTAADVLVRTHRATVALGSMRHIVAGRCPVIYFVL